MSAAACLGAGEDEQASTPQPEPAAAKADQPAPVSIDKAHVAALVAKLGDQQWTTREDAEKELVGLGPDVLPILDKYLPVAKDPEVLQRLERVFRDLTPQSQYAGDDARPGFLGIQLDVVVNDADPRLGERENGVLVMGVVADTAAEKAGLREGDLIVSLDGSKFLGDFSIDNFKNRIQRIGASGKTRVSLFRGQAYLNLDVVLGASPTPTGTAVRIIAGGNGVIQEVEVPPSADAPDGDAQVLAHRWDVWWRSHVDEVKRTAAGDGESTGEKPQKSERPSGNAETQGATTDTRNDKEKP